MLVDSHCHLADAAFEADLAPVLDRAWSAGVGHIVVIGESRETAERALALAAGERRLSVAIGVHPHDARSFDADQSAWLRGMLGRPGVVALGEIGLDYHYDFSPRVQQQAAFEAQLTLAAVHGLPVVVHAREADDDIAAILRNHPGVTAILHSFSSGPALLHAAISLGHYISFSGMITFRNWRLDAVIPEIPADRLLVETDAPFLAPIPHRGRRNEPAYVRLVAERLAVIRNLASPQFVELTGANARRVFGPRLTPGEELSRNE
ncbi:MAG: TatD family hydrolase [Gemmatimonadota bacterium]